MSAIEVIHTTLLSLVTVVGVGSLPWVISVERRLSKILNIVNNGLPENVSNLEARMRETEVRCAKRHPRSTT